ncbi:MAG: NlpC/P60 family protein [Stackebrandtia sp.]
MTVTPSRSRRCGQLLLGFIAAAAVAASTPVPALADPMDSGVPDDEARPEGDVGEAGGDAVPSGGDAPIAGPGVSRGPYATRIGEMAKDVADLGQRATDAEDEAELRRGQASRAFSSWSDLNTEADDLADLAADLAAEAYQEAAVEDIDAVAKYKELFELHPDLIYDDGDDLRDRAEDASEDAAVAKASLDSARAASAIADDTHEDLADQLDKDTKELEDLIAENLEAIQLEEQKSEIDNAHAALNLSTEVDGMEAAAEAQDAVRFALDQVGKPYEWGAEGPDTYDCSGLTQTAYSKQNLTLPRIANQQYRDTLDRAVAPEKLLPGDLIFYGDRSGDWTSVYHVGMYIGGGEMVHAPRPGDVVKVAPVWFSDYFGAHRVAPAVEVDGGPSTTSDSKDKDSEPLSDPEPEPATEPESGLPGGSNGGSPDPTPTPTPTP